MAMPAATPNKEKRKLQELLEEENEQLRKNIKNLKAELEEINKNCALGLEIAKRFREFEREEAEKRRRIMIARRFREFEREDAEKRRRIMQDAEKFSKSSA